jgi:hypothetical protein
MYRLLEILASCALGVLVLATPFVGPSVAWADEADAGDTAINGRDDDNPDVDDPVVAGIVYSIRDQAGAKVLRILDKDLGVSVDAFFTDPKLVALINNRTACTNRYVVARGVREGIDVLMGQGLEVDLSRPCGEPPR